MEQAPEKMNPVLEEIFRDNKVLDSKGTFRGLSSSIDLQEGLFIQQLIRTYRPKKTIEIGCANGISSTFICEAISEYASDDHLIVDAYQAVSWDNVGLHTLKRAGFSNFRLVEELSEIILPELLKGGHKFDFALIDGWHTFDHTLLDFFYLNRMLNVGGIIVIDDVSYPAIRKCVRYISNYPSYQQVGNTNQERLNWRRALFYELRAFLGRCVKPLGKKIVDEVFDQKVFLSDRKLGVDASMVAFKKIYEDTSILRDHDWYVPF